MQTADMAGLMLGLGPGFTVRVSDYVGVVHPPLIWLRTANCMCFRPPSLWPRVTAFSTWPTKVTVRSTRGHVRNGVHHWSSDLCLQDINRRVCLETKWRLPVDRLQTRRLFMV